MQHHGPPARAIETVAHVIALEREDAAREGDQQSDEQHEFDARASSSPA